MCLLVRKIVCAAIVLSARAQTPAAGDSAFVPAAIHGHTLTAFLSDRPKKDLDLPGRWAGFVDFGPDGEVIYVQDWPPDGLIKIEFSPLRASVVPGSNELGNIWHAAMMESSGRILAAGTSKTLRRCGTFEIDPATGTIRALLSGPILDCGGGGGAIAPDGKRALNPLGKELSIIELETGAVHAIKGIPGRTQPNDTSWVHNTAWSPDGKWISAILPDRDIVLIEAADTSRRKKLGHSDGSPVVWSPDSRFLLRTKSELRCTGFLYFDSLETIDVATGQRHVIPSSHCEVSGWIGWLDSNVVK